MNYFLLKKKRQREGKLHLISLHSTGWELEQHSTTGIHSYEGFKVTLLSNGFKINSGIFSDCYHPNFSYMGKDKRW